MEISYQIIGLLDDEYGCDVYYLVTRKDGDLTPEQAKAYMLPLLYRDGVRYCHVVRAVQAEHSTNKVICVAEQRYDV